MNAVEIEQAISHLAESPFDPAEFPYAFLEAFGNKATTIKILKNGKSNNTDLEGAVLQRNNIHIKICEEGQVSETLKALRESPTTSRQKAKYILATDGITLKSERLPPSLDCGTNDLVDRQLPSACRAVRTSLVDLPGLHARSVRAHLFT